ncbi:MAG TPA: class I SAM-dependent methyltransferase [Xanthobacteraceae bacterium]|jgi:ubiquinone/menaquinone biosynthesis C-methylase UbiE
MADLPGFFEGTEMPTAGWWEALWPDPGKIVTAVGVSAAMTVVDLCSGDGWFTLQIAKRARRVIAVDIDRRLLDLARLRLAENGVTNCEFVAGDAYELARLVPAPVDFVFLANVFHGIPDRARLAAAVCQVLAPGGRFAVVNWHKRPREETTVLGEPRGPRTELRITPQQTIDAVAPSGLKFLELMELPPYHYAAIFARAPFQDAAAIATKRT